MSAAGLLRLRCSKCGELVAVELSRIVEDEVEVLEAEVFGRTDWFLSCPWCPMTRGRGMTYPLYLPSDDHGGQAALTAARSEPVAP